MSSVRSRAVKFKQLRHFTAAAGVALGLCACAAVPPRPTPQAEAIEQPLAHLAVALPDADHDVMAQLLAGEMALTRTDLKSAALHYGKAMALSDDPEVASRAAGLAIAVHDDDTAARALDRWQALGARPVELAQGRAELALGRGDAAEAKRQLALLSGSGDKDAWRQFGRVLAGARDQAQAGRLLEALATPQRLPDDVQAWLAMSELGEKFGRHAYAVGIADAAMARFGNAEAYAWAARLRFQDGDSAGARKLLDKALAKAPKNPRLRLTYAAMLSQGGDDAGAARVLRQGPQTADIYAMRAGVAAHQRDGKALEALYREMQQASPEVRQSSAFLLGQLAEMQRRNEEALAWYDQVADGDEHAFDADLRSALLLYELGKPVDAHQLLAQLQMDYLDEPEQLRQAWQADAELYMRAQDYAAAESAFSHALQVLPDDPGLLYGRGLARAEIGRIDQAVQDFSELLKLKPGDVDASNALGYTLADADRDLPQAEQLILVARKAKPDDPTIADSWGWLQYRQGHVEQAAQTLRGAWAVLKDPDVGVHLAEVLWKLGQAGEARKLFDEVRKLDPGNSRLKETLERLQP